jgi:hypothetical protein
VTPYSLEIWDLNPGAGRRFSLFYTDPDRPSNPQGLFPEVKVPDLALTTHSIWRRGLKRVHLYTCYRESFTSKLNANF